MAFALVDAVDLGVAELGLADIGLAHVDVDQVGTAQVGAGELGWPQIAGGPALLVLELDRLEVWRGAGRRSSGRPG